MSDESPTITEMIDAAVKDDARFENEQPVPLLKLASMLPHKGPYILAVPNPEKPDTTMVVANGTEEELFNCAAAFVSWIGNVKENEVGRSGDDGHPLYKTDEG